MICFYSTTQFTKKSQCLFTMGNRFPSPLSSSEIIDETWPENPLLPSLGDPHGRALARFWTKFIDDKALPFALLLMTDGEELEKAAKEVREILKILEDQGLGEKFFGGSEIGLADLALGLIASTFGVIEPHNKSTCSKNMEAVTSI